MAKPRRSPKPSSKLPLFKARHLSIPTAVLFALIFLYGGYRVLIASHASSPPLAIHVSGNQLVNASGQPIRLIGVDRFGDCGGGIAMHGPTDQNSVNQLLKWHINVVRIIMNEDCWLGINGEPTDMTVAAFQSTIVSYIDLLNQNGIYVIFDLHTNAPGSLKSDAQQVLADEDHAPAYWTSVADTFRSRPAVILEPYNEPHVTTANTAIPSGQNPWWCWLHGSTDQHDNLVPGQCLVNTYNEAYGGPQEPLNWQPAGMQQLVTIIRNEHANNVITLGGLGYSNDMSQMLSYLPTDPDHQLAATFHVYKGWGCGYPSCWNGQVLSVAAQMPVITDEFGQHDCGSDFVSTWMNWADTHNVSYLSWVWVPSNCPSLGGQWAGSYGLLESDYQTPNSYGSYILSHFQAIAPSPTPTPTPTPLTPTPTPPTTPPSTPTPTAPPSSTPGPGTGSGSGGSGGGSSTLSFGSGTISVNGQIVSKNGSLNTSYLTNGKHTVTITQNGQTKTETIDVKNKLNPFETLRNFLFASFVGHPLAMNVGTALVLLLPLIILGFILKKLLAKKLLDLRGVRSNLS